MGIVGLGETVMKLVNTNEQMTPCLFGKTMLNVMLISALTALIFGVNVEPAHAENKLVIQADLGKVTIDKNIYGHFSEHLGRCVYEDYWVGEDSPIPNARGIRNDVVDALKQIKVPVLRWPGLLGMTNAKDH